jgi:glycosyltransferase involved in cell wall biosynthesis
MTAPSVSVIIPAYNCGGMLRQAVESVRRQSYQDLEVIIVDDGSDDDTPKVIRNLAADWDKVRPIRADHLGLAAARNRGIAEMRGEWIALLDADDLWLPEKLTRCMDYLAGHESVSIVYTPMQPIRLDGEPMTGHSKPCHAGRLTRKLFKSIFVHDPAAVFHKRVIEKCGPFDESLPVCVGHEFWLRVSTAFEFGLINEPLALRRWHEKSLTRSNRARGRCIKADMLERFYFERGGKDLLDRKEAFRRLSRVHYSAGKILLKQGRCRRGRGFLAKAVRYNPANLKAWPLYAACLFGSLFRRARFSEA